MDPGLYKESLAQESRRWATHATDHLTQPSWVHSDTILRHINSLVSGDENVAWIDYLRDRHFPPERWGGQGLSLGCNYGILERQIVQAGICSRLDAYDISENSIAYAREETEKAGANVRFKVVDVNTMHLESRSYSLVIVVMALHHFEQLEHIFTQIHEALEPGGVFVYNEYVGPSRFQWTDLQLTLINRFRACLPPALRMTREGKPAPLITRPDLDRFIQTEPFEAIRSEEILPLTRKHFNIIDQRDYGGTLLHMLFHGIMGNFDEENEDHVALIRILCTMERAMMETGILPSDFTVVAARRRDSG